METVFAVFLCVCAWRDLRDRKIPVLLLMAAAAAGVLEIAGHIFCFEWQSGRELRLWLGMRAAAVIPGIFLLIISKCSRGAVGRGDGLFFMVSGLYLGFWRNVALLLYGLIFCSAWGCGVFLWGIFAGKRVKDIELPFLTFLIPAALLLAVFERMA